MEKGLASRVLDLVPEAVAEGSTKGAGRNSSRAEQTRDHGDSENHNDNDDDNDGAHCIEGVGVNGGEEGKEQLRTELITPASQVSLDNSAGGSSHMKKTTEEAQDLKKNNSPASF
ncbi:hypothetical protein AHAS_Ahas03G0335300 [Arachis hypogaea]